LFSGREGTDGHLAGTTKGGGGREEEPKRKKKLTGFIKGLVFDDKSGGKLDYQGGNKEEKRGERGSRGGGRVCGNAG